MQTIAPTQSAALWYASPPRPNERNRRVVPRSVAIVMPEIGFDDDPIRPTMREETATKKKPKIRMSTPVRRLAGNPPVGRFGRNAITRTRITDPIATQEIGMSRSVLGTAIPL